MTRPGLLLVVDGLQQLGDGERFEVRLGLHQDRPVGAQREARPELLLAGCLAHGNRDDLGGDFRLAQTNRLLDGDLAERVDGHLDVGQVDAGAVGLHPDLDVGVHDALDGYQYLHGADVLVWLICRHGRRTRSGRGIFLHYLR